MNYLQRFQKRHGLEPDGIIGTKTALAFMKELDIDNKAWLAHLLGQVSHESAGFTVARENLNYSGENIRRVFGKYFKGSFSLASYTYNPVRLGNRVYANRMGNKDEASGDGFRNRGVGGLQITGEYNINAYLASIGLPHDTDRDILEADEHFFKIAKFYFDKNDVWKYCKKVDFDHCLLVSRRINLGDATTKRMPLGTNERFNATVKIYKAIS